MASAISIGQTGLVASSKQLDVIANNLANSSTAGFKASGTLFASMMGQGLSSSGSLAVGQGVGVANMPRHFAQGSFETTGNVLDMAIDGEGFFIVVEPGVAPLYTRAGSFHIDKNNYLVDNKGYKVQGYKEGAAVQSDIILPKNKDATPTQNISFGANLNEATEPTKGTFEITQTVFDSMGGTHLLTVVFTKDAAPGTWTLTGRFDADDPAVPVSFSVPKVVFNEKGRLTEPTVDPEITINGTNPLKNGATIGNAGKITWNLITDKTRELTGYTSDSIIRSLYADGYASGELRRLSVDSRGVISGVYTNGQTLELYQIALANFMDQSALATSGSYYLETMGSGRPTSNRAATAGLGNIQGNSLESSNTDVSKEFISMITAQRAYQANARVITTADSMLTELMNIKR